ncbi:MAG: M48 family metallopeptidase [Thermodesulfobacteriota bacterium]
MTDIYSQQKRNRRVTAVLVAGFILFVAAVGASIDVYNYGSFDGLRTPVATVAAFTVALTYGAVSLYGGSALVLRSAGAVPPAPENLTHRTLHNVVTEMCLAGGLPMPRIYVIPDPAPNAFATGRSPGAASVAVTQGLLDATNREELQAVVAHEMAHIRNNDIRTMTVVAVLLGTSALLTDWAIRTWRYAGVRSRARLRGKGLGPLALLVIALFVLVSPVISRIMAMAVSRSREYQADATAAELTRNPKALASALEKIQEATSPVRSAHKGTAHLFISDPLKRRSSEREGFFANLFSTHPPLERRIERLRKMGYAWDRFGHGRAGAGAEARAV